MNEEKFNILLQPLILIPIIQYIPGIQMIREYETFLISLTSPFVSMLTVICHNNIFC